MPQTVIQAPGRRLLRDIPLAFIRRGGHEKRKVDAHIALVPFIDLLLCVVLFLLMSFSATGEIRVQANLPVASSGVALESAPIVAVDEDRVTVDGRHVADTRGLLQGSQLERIGPLVRDLETQRTNWSALHPSEPFTGHVIIQASRVVDYRAVRKVLFSVSQAGYRGIQLAVRPR